MQSIRLRSDSENIDNLINTLNDISKTLPINTKIRPVNANMNASPEMADILITGKDILLAVLPIIAFYLGKGKKFTVSIGDTNISCEGYKEDEIKRLISEAIMLSSASTKSIDTETAKNGIR